METKKKIYYLTGTFIIYCISALFKVYTVDNEYDMFYIFGVVTFPICIFFLYLNLEANTTSAKLKNLFRIYLLVAVTILPNCMFVDYFREEHLTKYGVKQKTIVIKVEKIINSKNKTVNYYTVNLKINKKVIPKTVELSAELIIGDTIIFFISEQNPRNYKIEGFKWKNTNI